MGIWQRRWMAVAAALGMVAGLGAQSARPVAPNIVLQAPPNVLFIAVDDLNDWTGKLGGHPQAITPNLDRLFAGSVYFTRAHSNAPVCVASRHSMLSGLRPTTTGWYDNVGELGVIRENWRTVLADTVPMPKHFKDHGYEVRGAGKIYHGGPADFAAEELWHATLPRYEWPEGFNHWRYNPTYGPMPPDGGEIFRKYGPGGHSLTWAALEPEDIPGNRMPDEVTADWAIEQLGQAYDRPFFLAVGFIRPHVPFTAPKRYFDLFDREAIQVPDVPDNVLADVPIYGKAMAHEQFIPGGDHPAVLGVSKTYWRDLVLGYLACVAFVDDQIGRVIAALDDSPHAGNTIVVLWSDHGQHLGEKKTWRKNTLWEQATRVPLAFRIPGSPNAGRPSGRPVSLVDVYPTLIELCGLPEIPALDGTSLVPLLNDPEARWDRPVLTTWHYRNHSVRSERWRYTVYRDGSEELYDHDADPTEHVNLAGDSRYADVIAGHRRWLPASEAVPNGDASYRGDRYDDLVRQWEEAGGPPDWLQ